MKYGSPFPSSKFKRMYLTGWQMRELRDEAGITCDFVELTKKSFQSTVCLPNNLK